MRYLVASERRRRRRPVSSCQGVKNFRKFAPKTHFFEDVGHISKEVPWCVCFTSRIFYWLPTFKAGFIIERFGFKIWSKPEISYFEISY